MRNSTLAIAIAFVVVATGTTYRPQLPDGNPGLTAKGTLGGSTGTTKPPLQTTGSQHR